MNNNIAIRVNNLTKIYHLYDKPQDRLKEALNLFKKSYHHDFYAVDDVSFEIKKGETVGIIGKNGAGKSTLLKMITGVLTPTNGSVEVNGKIASLLELGAGFNPEMTGLENIYLNGTLMGFSHEEMENKIDTILEFADIGEFIYQQVKTYSSGMFARLAFSVAINVEPEILIVDEALSVGDARFQAKCIRKMEDIANVGTTIIFVSHDTQSVNKFCKNVIWLNEGKIIKEGNPGEILEDYMSFMAYGLKTDRENNSSENANLVSTKEYKFIDLNKCDSFGEKNALIDGIVFLSENNKATNFLKQGENCKIVCSFHTKIDLYNVAIGILFKDTLNNEIFTLNSYMYDSAISSIKANTSCVLTIEFIVPKIFPKEYIIAVALSEGTQDNHNQQHWIHEATTINVISIDNIDLCVLSIYKNEVKFNYKEKV